MLLGRGMLVKSRVGGVIDKTAGNPCDTPVSQQVPRSYEPRTQSAETSPIGSFLALDLSKLLRSWGRHRIYSPWLTSELHNGYATEVCPLASPESLPGNLEANMIRSCRKIDALLRKNVTQDPRPGNL